MSDVREAIRSRRVDQAIGVALFLATVVLVSATSESIGFTRDEGYYFKAGELYAGWFSELWRDWMAGDFTRPFSAAVVDKHWSYNHEHPALVKTAFALSWLWFKQNLGWFTLHSEAFRFPAFLFSGLATLCIYGLSRELLSRRASIFAAVLWVSLPHPFWHMHLACFDVPVTAAHAALVWAWLRWRRTLGGGVKLGVTYALASAVKHNVMPVPGLFVIHWFLCEAKGFGRTKTGFVLPRVPMAFFTMAVVGPLVYFLHWPWLWSQPLSRIGGYFGFHLGHEHYPILWFHDLLTRPPFPVSFPFVMSALTVPVPALILFVAGFVLACVVGARLVWTRWSKTGGDAEWTRVPLGRFEPSGSAAILLALNAAYPFVLIALPSTPIFGGTKHWMNGLPFLCVLAAWVLEEGFARAAAAWPSLLPAARSRIIVAVVAVLCVVPGYWISARAHPNGLSSYNELAGFARGAANIGMQRTFWGYEPRPALPIINERTPPRGRIHFGDTNRDDHAMYRRDGLLREDIGLSGAVRGSAVAAVQPQGEFKQQWIDVWNEWKKRSPDVVVDIEGVPLGTVTFSAPVPGPAEQREDAARPRVVAP